MLLHIGTGLCVIFGLIYLYFTGLLVYQCYILRKFKGPFPLPLVGNLYESGALYFLRHLSKLRKRYGKIFTFISLVQPYIVVCDPVVIRRVLSDSKTFIKGDDYTTYFNIAFGSSLVTSNGEKHKHDRGIFGRFFVRGNIAKFFGTANMLSAQAVDEKIAEANGKSLHVNIEEFFATLALRTFGLFAMNVDYRVDRVREKEICHMVSVGSLKVAEMVGYRPPLWDMVPQVGYCRRVRAEFSRDFQVLMTARSELIAKNEAPDDCLTAMLNEKMEFEEMVDHIMTLLCAGHDTTAFFSSYLSLILAQHQDVQEKIYQEMQSVLGDREEITTDDASNLLYFQKCMQETLRLYAVIPQVSRLCTAETYIKEANVTLPKGSNILVPLFLVNRDPELWENPSQFNPERFEGKVDFTSAKNGFFPFGYGARTCIGNTLAQLESTIFFCHLLRKFKIEEKPGFKPQIMSGISLTTSNGIHVVLTPR